MASRMEMDGKVVIITGASSGLGEAIAYLMATEGAKVAICGRDQQKLDSVLDKCKSLRNPRDEKGEYFVTIRGDLTSSEHRKEIVSTTVEKFGKIDVLVPNAGMVHPGNNIANATEEVYDQIMDINLKSVFFLIQQAAPHLKETRGVIVCMSSVYTAMPNPLSQIYSMSKAAIDYMVKAIACSYGPSGIRVNAVNPSFVVTDLLRTFPSGEQVANVIAERECPNHILDGTRCCTAEEVAQTVLFLASNRSSFTTGGIHYVDGGRRLNIKY